MPGSPLDTHYSRPQVPSRSSSISISMKRSETSTSSSKNPEKSTRPTTVSEWSVSPKSVSIRSLRRSSSISSGRPEIEADTIDPFEGSVSEQHAPASIYGVPAYLEAPDRPIVHRGVMGWIKTIVKSVFSAALVIGLIFGYVYSVKVIDIHVTTVGIYGTILMADFITQYSCAILNRWDVVRLVRAKKALMGCPPEQRRKPWQIEAKQDPVLPNPFDDAEKQGQAVEVPRHHLMNPDAEVSIAVVGYREDEQAWKECLRSLQKQKLKPKCIVGVVDGNDQPDLDMANAFMEEFADHNSLMVHLPVLLSALHRKTYFDTLATFPDERSRTLKVWHRVSGYHTDAQKASLKAALDVVLKQVDAWEAEYNLSSYEALCFSQPHGHKRTAMFTAFAISLWAVKTKHAIFTTDSDTLVKDDALDEMLTLLQSHGNVGGVTGDVKIWNRAESFLARLCAVRYWFAFNIERACQSWWRCVSCLSGPMSMYRSHDLHVILGMWNIQTFQGKETTFGDDRHLTNQILAQGFKTRYTHRTWCESESPTQFPRWVKQQTRWSKSFFREAFWFPHAFALHSWWMLVEITKQSLYPFILVATVFRFLFEPTAPFRPVIWIVTMFAIALAKSIAACLMSADPWLLVFSLYGFVYFFGLLPSKIFALLTMNKTTWGTSARSATEIKIGASFIAEFYHLGHLCLWYLCTTFGLAFFCSVIFEMPLLPLVGLAGLIPCYMLFYGLPNPLTPLRSLKTKMAKVLVATSALFSSLFVKKSAKTDEHFTSKPPSTLVRPQRPPPIVIVDSPSCDDEKTLMAPYPSPVKTRGKRSDSTASMTSLENLPVYRSRANSTASMILEKPMGKSKRAYSVASMMLEKSSPGRSRASSAASLLEKPIIKYMRSDSIASTSEEPYARYQRSNSTASEMTLSPPPRYRSDSMASTSQVPMQGRARAHSNTLPPPAFALEIPMASRNRPGFMLERQGSSGSPLRSTYLAPIKDVSSPDPADWSFEAMPGRRHSDAQHSSFAPTRLHEEYPAHRAFEGNSSEEETSPPYPGSRRGSLAPTANVSQASGILLSGRGRSNSVRKAVPPPLPNQQDRTGSYLQTPAPAASLFAPSYHLRDTRRTSSPNPAAFPNGVNLSAHCPRESDSSASESSSRVANEAKAGLTPPTPARMRSGSITAARGTRMAERGNLKQSARSSCERSAATQVSPAYEGSSSVIGLALTGVPTRPGLSTWQRAEGRRGSSSRTSLSVSTEEGIDPHTPLSVAPAASPSSEDDARGSPMVRGGEVRSRDSVASQNGYAF